MELTLENKAKFFAQYWRQLVLLHEETKIISHVSHTFMSPKIVDIHCLLLKPLTSITDYDLSVLAYEFDVLIGSNFADQYDDLKDFRDNLDISASWPIGFFDYLRSKGYALPFMGLSVEQMVEAGWIKLKGGDNV